MFGNNTPTLIKSVPFLYGENHFMEKRKDIVIQANPLVEARKPLSTMQARLFYLALQDVNPHLSGKDKYYDKNFKESFFTPSELKEIFGGSGEYIKLAQQACDNLTDKKVVIKGEDGSFLYIPVFGIAEYKPNVGLRLGFNTYMRPYLLDIFESGFPYTKISMKQIFNLSSSYAMRLLELMLQFRGTMKNKMISRKMTIKDLRFALNVPQKAYTQTGDLKRFVINIAQREINKKTAYRLTYEQIKTGRKITGFLFVLDCHEMLLEGEITDVKVERIPKKQDRHELSEKIVNKLTTLCGSNAEYKKRMDYAVSLLEKRKPENVQAFLYKAVAENYLQQELDRQAEEKKKARAQKAWDDFVNELDEQSKTVLLRMIQIGKVAPMMAKSLLEKYGVERCRRNFEAQRKKTNASNLAGLIVFAIQQDFEGQLEAFEAQHPQNDAMDDGSIMIDGQKYHLEPMQEVKPVSEDEIQPELRKYMHRTNQ